MGSVPPLLGLVAAVTALGLLGWSMRGVLAMGIRALAGREPASRATLGGRYWILVFAALVATLLAVAILMLVGAPGWPILVALALVAVALGLYVAAMVVVAAARRRK